MSEGRNGTKNVDRDLESCAALRFRRFTVGLHIIFRNVYSRISFFRWPRVVKA